jgi:hypothetical protein
MPFLKSWYQIIFKPTRKKKVEEILANLSKPGDIGEGNKVTYLGIVNELQQNYYASGQEIKQVTRL